MAYKELKKEIEGLKEEIKKIKEFFESKGPVEYLEYTCPHCVPGQSHKFPRIPGTKHYMHWGANSVHSKKSKYLTQVTFEWVLEIKEDGSLDVYKEVTSFNKTDISKGELIERGYRFIET